MSKMARVRDYRRERELKATTLGILGLSMTEIARLLHCDPWTVYPVLKRPHVMAVIKRLAEKRRRADAAASIDRFVTRYAALVAAKGRMAPGGSRRPWRLPDSFERANPRGNRPSF